MRKISSLLAITLGMVMLSGCGDTTDVTAYSDFDAEDVAAPIEHIPVGEKTDDQEEDYKIEHISINQKQEYVEVNKNVNTSPAGITHVPVTENYYTTTVNNDYSTYVKKDNHINYEQSYSSEVNTDQSEETHINSGNSLDYESNESFTDVDHEISTNIDNEIYKEQTTTIAEENTAFSEEEDCCKADDDWNEEDSMDSIFQKVEKADSDLDKNAAETLRTPVLSEWKKTMDTVEMKNPMSDGVQYTITWEPIKDADGYEVELKLKETTDEDADWFTKVTTVTEPTFSESFSHIEMYLKARVRAYKITGSTKEYSNWSKEQKGEYHPY